MATILFCRFTLKDSYTNEKLVRLMPWKNLLTSHQYQITAPLYEQN